MQDRLSIVAIAALQTSVSWYATLLGREPDDGVCGVSAIWLLADGSQLMLQLAPEVAGGSSVTIRVDDLDVAVATLAERGITAEIVDATSGAFRFALVRDPDDNSVLFVEITGEPPAAAQP